MDEKDECIQALEAQIKKLKLEISSLKTQTVKRPTMEVMLETAVDTNPYSRLMAIKRMGIVKNYENIRNFTVVVVGIGGVGSVAAEMLARCGIGKLILFDYDKVELANMNRLFFRPEHTGMYKTTAALKVLTDINPDVVCEGHNFDITTIQGYSSFKTILASNSKSANCPVDLVLGCVDNFQARYTINKACLELNLPWFESGVAENAVSGHIQFIVPGHSACYQCAPPLIVESGIPEETLKREGVCAASLPTTMGLVSAVLVQNALKYLLKFGVVSFYVGYMALNDFFPLNKLLPNPECIPLCKQRQAEYSNLTDKPTFDYTIETTDEPLHTENPYGIELVSVSSQDEETILHPTSEIKSPEKETTPNSIQSLKAKLASLQSK